jgi:hypothetical protein
MKQFGSGGGIGKPAAMRHTFQASAAISAAARTVDARSAPSSSLLSIQVPQSPAALAAENLIPSQSVATIPLSGITDARQFEIAVVNSFATISDMQTWIESVLLPKYSSYEMKRFAVIVRLQQQQ